MKQFKVINLMDEQERAELTTLITGYIDDDNAVHSQRIPKLNKIEERLTSDITVSGFSQAYLDDLAALNNPASEGDQRRQKQMVSVNRAFPNHEAVLGDFISLKRKMSIQGRTPKDRKLAKVIRARVEYIEDAEMLGTKVYFPLMDNALSKGLHWLKVRYNVQANKLKGKFEIDDISCRDILVDCRSRGNFFKSARRKTHRFQLPLEEAREKYRIYPAFQPEALGADTEYDQAYGRTESDSEDYATFYEVHLQERVINYYFANPESGKVETVEREEFDKMSENPKTAEFVFEGDEQYKKYAVLFNRSVGAFGIEENPFEHDILIPLVCIELGGQLYPYGYVEIYANLLDLLDTLVTVLLQSAKRANKPIATGDMQMWKQYEAEILDALEHGGYAPGVTNINYQQSINPALIEMIRQTLGWIQDSVSKHSASMGELPSKQIAKETVQALMAKDRQSQGRFDMTLNYALTSLAKIMVEMISEFETDPDFFPITDSRPGQVGYIPVNQRWTEAEYMGQIAELYNIAPKSQDENANIQIEQQIQEARRKFEQENDVDIEEIDGYTLPSLPEGAREYTPDQLDALIEQSGLSDEEFFAVYQPREGKIKLYVVNDLSKDVDLNIKYSIDQDFENDPQYKANRALMLNTKGMMSRTDTLKELNVPNAEELIENADAENKSLQLAKELASKPELMNAVMNVLKGIGQPQAGNGQPTQ